jgi:hypothetical protein
MDFYSRFDNNSLDIWLCYTIIKIEKALIFTDIFKGSLLQTDLNIEFCYENEKIHTRNIELFDFDSDFKTFTRISNEHIGVVNTQMKTVNIE